MKRLKNRIENLTINDLVGYLIVMDTHSGDLMTYEIAVSSTITLNNEITISQGLEWFPESESSHHRSGVLKLPLPEYEISSISLEMKDLMVPSRKFTWNIEL